MNKEKKFTIDHLRESIVIVIEPDGTHHVKLPEDDHLEVSAKAYNDLMNTMTVINEPSFVLKFFLMVERVMQNISKAVFGQA
tara:strand:- start:1019 stop:1264 length:246 start_codon:yes stop_codon:yes gene_type:complete